MSDKPHSRITMYCSNPKCKRFLCTIKVHTAALGMIAEVTDVKCRKCKHLTCFAVHNREKKEDSIKEGAKNPT